MRIELGGVTPIQNHSVGWVDWRPIRRILMVGDAVGGVWTYMKELARGLAPHHVELLVVVMGPRPSEEQVEEIASLGHVELIHGDYALEWMDTPWDEVDQAGDWLLRLAASYEPDIVHLNGFSHAELPWPAPVLVVAHSCVLTWWRAVKGEGAPARYHEYIRRVGAALESAFVVTPTDAFRTHLAREYGLCPRGVTISNARSPVAAAASRKEPFILSAGRLWDEAKNLSILDRIAPDLNWPVLVAGDEALPGSGRFASSNVKLMGRLPPSDLAETMARASIYAAPALYEPFGLAILEAALSGCALILGDIPTLRELWDGSAEFIPCRDVDGWRRGLQKVVADSTQCARLQHRARQAAAPYSVKRQAEAYMEAYRSLISIAAPASQAIAV